MSALKIQVEVRTEQQSARNYGCGHCNRTAMTETNGVLVVKNTHGGDVHPNGFMVSSLIKDYIGRAGTQQLNEMEAVIARRRAALGGLGIARPNQNGGPRLR